MLENAEIPLAPLPEQRRIVQKVEALLEQVSQARERLDRVHLILRRFRQAVLAAACSGELTREWREERDDSASDLMMEIRRIVEAQPRRRRTFEIADKPDLDLPQGWIPARVGELITVVTSGSRGWAEFYSESGPLFIRAQNINTDSLVLADMAHVSPPANSEGARTRVHKNDVLVTITGANVTKTALVEHDIGEAYVSQHVGLVRPALHETAPWICAWLVSPAHGRKQLLDAAYGAGKPGLNLDNLREVEIALPPLPEQGEIVRQVRPLLGLANAIERRVLAATARTDKLPQAILSKAFSGELVPTEAELARIDGRTFETAEELLKNVMTSSSEAISNGKGRRSRDARKTG